MDKHIERTLKWVEQAKNSINHDLFVIDCEKKQIEFSQRAIELANDCILIAQKQIDETLRSLDEYKSGLTVEEE